MNIFSFSPFGYEGAVVTVEVDLRRGIPAVDIVGLADGAVKESRERMQAAIRNSGFEFPPERVLISLSPADLKKEGAGFDLPVALGVLTAKAELLGEEDFISESLLIMGELELSGNIRPVKGVNAAVSTASSMGIKYAIVPKQNAEEAREVSGIKVFGADCLINAYNALKDKSLFSERSTKKLNSDIIETGFLPEGVECVNKVYFQGTSSEYEFADIKGQYQLIRGLQIAAAGGHNFIAMGAPGCGKTMAIQKFPAILPLLTLEEAQSVTRIWSLAGLINPNEPLIRIPPFRMPHQTASIEGICGGGTNCRPGEISLAHNGVLFLDEAAEFKTSVLQMLRVPLESGTVTLSRAGRSTTYPASFQLMMAVNPCPCGNFGSKTKICLCSAKSIEQYWRKFSAPLLDRIDLRVFVENNSGDMEDKLNGELYDNERTALRTTLEIRKGVATAVNIQRKREVRNCKLTPQLIEKYCQLSQEAEKVLNNSINRYGFSPRAISSCLKTARTIADIAGEECIQTEHIREAIEYRKLCCNMIPEL